MWTGAPSGNGGPPPRQREPGDCVQKQAQAANAPFRQAAGRSAVEESARRPQVQDEAKHVAQRLGPQRWRPAVWTRRQDASKRLCLSSVARVGGFQAVCTLPGTHPRPHMCGRQRGGLGTRESTLSVRMNQVQEKSARGAVISRSKIASHQIVSRMSCISKPPAR